MDPPMRRQRLVRRWFLRRVRAAAAAVGATVEVDLARDVRLGRRIVVDVEPGSANRLSIGEGTRIWDDVTFALRGGDVTVGPWCDIRRGVVVNAAGTVRIVGRNVVSWGTVVHCAGLVEIGELTSIGEYVTIVDSTHYHSEPDVPVHRNLRIGSIAIGRNAWIGAKATILRDSVVGAYAVVAAGAVVSGSVPDGHVVAAPGSATRDRELPWGGVTA